MLPVFVIWCISVVVLTACIIVPYLANTFSTYEAETRFIELAGDRAYRVQQLGEATQGIIYGLHGWVPLNRIESYQLELQALAEELRRLNLDVYSLSTHHRSWLTSPPIPTIEYDGLQPRPSISAPTGAVHSLYGNQTMQIEASLALNPGAYASMRRAIEFKLPDAVHRLTDLAMVLALRNVSAYMNYSDNRRRNDAWQTQVLYLLDIIENSHVDGPTNRMAVTAMLDGRDYIVASASTVASAAAAFLSVLLLLLGAIIIFIYIPLLRKVSGLRNLTVRRFLKIPVRVIRLLHVESMRHVKMFQQLQVCSTDC